MHSRIFQLESEPVAENDSICSDSIPDWFTSSIADYVANTSEEAREEEIRWMLERLGMVCRREGDKLTFNIDVSAFFEHDFERFKHAVEGLSKVKFDEFAGDRPSDLPYIESLNHLMFLVADAYDDDRGFYVWNEDELWTMSSWMRQVEPCSTYYIGGIVDYHF